MANLGIRPVSVIVALSAALAALGDGVEANELAWALMRSKNERWLCDRLADCLREEFANESNTMVIREWGRGVQELGRRRVDLAVCRGGIPVALIETKVARSFDLAVKTERRYPSKPIQYDIEKLRSVEPASERYVLLFVTHNHGVPETRGDSIPYVDEMRRYGAIDQDEIDHGIGRVQQVFENDASSCVKDRIAAGNALGVDVTLFYWLYSIR